MPSHNAHNMFTLRPISSLICYQTAQGCTGVIGLQFGDIHPSNELGYQQFDPKGLRSRGLDGKLLTVKYKVIIQYG